ncbi:MAG: ergothioneine biosynthesis protein EgtB [Actinomyces sp.]|nr:MAG: ergothioneine biosynthesis protein EgtB [Actinomyces sp.]
MGGTVAAPAAPPDGTLTERYRAVRALTEQLAAPLSAEDQTVQSMPDVSPTKWHRAHTTWFFETFCLNGNLPGYRPVDPAYAYLFNSYYEQVGARHPRPQRGLVTRPGIAEIAEYRRRVDEAMDDLLERVVPGRPDLAALVELGLHHEQQHQELLLMDIAHVLSVNPTRPLYDERPVPEPGRPDEAGWVAHPGGIVSIGHTGEGFAFDNEGPRHEVLLRPFAVADRLVTCGEWLEFMADDAYRTPTLWLSDGWYTVQAEGWESPAYWHRTDEGWFVHTLTGFRPVDPAEPVVHVSYYEADAFARWSGHRLPTEFEWEAVAVSVPVEGNLLPAGYLHPRPAPPADGRPRQLFGDVWEWTASAYQPYPGFRPAPGAVGEYNGKFMVDQQVLRGGCAVTPGGHVRPTYRNFFPARARWHFGGVRLAADR